MAKTDGQFKAGNSGKPKGAVNKVTRTVKETVLSVFNELQESPKHSLKAFAEENPKEFYTIASKLIPTEITGGLKLSGFKITYGKRSATD